MVLSVTVNPAHISKTFSRDWGWAGREVFLQKKPPSTSFPCKGLDDELQQQSLERTCVQQAADGALGDLTDFTSALCKEAAYIFPQKPLVQPHVATMTYVPAIPTWQI